MKLIVKTDNPLLFFTRKGEYSNLLWTKIIFDIFIAFMSCGKKLKLSTYYTHTAKNFKKNLNNNYLIVENL